MDFEKVWHTLTDCWQIKFISTCAVMCLNYLFGDIDKAFLGLWFLVFLDLFTAWARVSRETLEEFKLNAPIWVGFMLAWKVQNLNSYQMRFRFVTKCFAYIVLLIAAERLGNSIPNIIADGKNWIEAPGDFVILYLTITEFISILENLAGMGVQSLAPLKKWAEYRRNKLLDLGIDYDKIGGDRHDRKHKADMDESSADSEQHKRPG